jgi:Zn finger protein HypA/HybF involved in hydrogenase expression
VSIAASVAGSSESKSVALGESFKLRVGESAQIEAEALQIGFEDVSADSRCPKGERCIWEGDATVRVWLHKAPDPKQTRELHTSPKEQGSVSYLSYGLRLVGLDPYPISGKTIERGDYQATLEVTRGSVTEPER